MNYDCVIIGAGVAGMSAALTLAKRGMRIVLAEKRRRVAPLLRGFKREGVRFDTGLHYLGAFGTGEILDRYCRFLGLEGLKKEPFRADGYDRICLPKTGMELDIPYGYERMYERLCIAFPSEAEAIKAYLEAVKKVFKASPFLNLDEAVSVKDFVKTAWDNETLEAFIHQHTRNPLLAAVFSLGTLLHGSAPNDVTFSQHAKIVSTYYQSAHAIRGGGASMARAFERALQVAGVDVMCGDGVREIVTSSAGSLLGVTLESGAKLESSRCILTSHPLTVLDLVAPSVFRPAYRKRVAALKETPSAHALFGVSDAPLETLEKRAVYILPHLNINDYFESGLKVGKGPYFVTVLPQSDGRRAVSVVTPGSSEATAPYGESAPGRRGPAYALYKREAMEIMQRDVFHGCPELQDKVRFLEGATPLTFRDYLGHPRCGIYGAAHSVNQFNPQPVTKLHGLYLAGQAIVAPGVLGAMVSAFVACGAIIGLEAIHEELRGFQ